MMNKENKKGKMNLSKGKILAIIVTLFAIVALIVMTIVFLKIGQKQNGENGYEEPINEKFSFLVDTESTKLKNDDIFSGQMDISKRLNDEYNKGKFTIDNPYVVVNPYVISPQTALIMFATKKSEKVTLTIKGKHNDDIIRTFEASKDHFIPVYGLYGNYENEVVVKTESGSSKTIRIKIEAEAITGATTVTENKLGNSNGEFYFATSSLGMGNVAYDNYGEVRWWLNIGFTKGMTMLQNGHLLLSSAKEGPDVTSTSGVVELDMLGHLLREYEIEGGYHHDGCELPNENLIILTSKIESDTLADLIVELDRNTGKIVKEWDMKKIVSKVDYDLIEHGDVAWGWINSITYDDSTKSLVMSLRNQNSVVSIDYEKGTINWILGEKKYWSNKFDEYLIKGEGTDFIYPSGQHSVNMLSGDRLSIFNNGYNANHEKPYACSSFANNASYAMVYKLDIPNKKASVEYKFGGKQYFSYALSSYTYAKNNHKVFNSGWHFTDKVEYNNPECNQFSNDKYDAYLIEFDENNNIVLNMHIEESKFEVEKADIYNLASSSIKKTEMEVVPNYSAKDGHYLTTLDVDEYEELSEEEALKYQANESLAISFFMYNNRFRFIGAIPSALEAKVTFISPSGKAYRYLLKEANKEVKEFIILDKLPKGRYYVYANWGEYVYNTTQFIEIK